MWLRRPFVLAISEPGDKLFVGDESLLSYVKISVNVSELLPDVLIADVADPVALWVVGAVHSNDPITEERKPDLLARAAKQGIPRAHAGF